MGQNKPLALCLGILTFLRCSTGIPQGAAFNASTEVGDVDASSFNDTNHNPRKEIKYPDMVICDTVYGENIEIDPCQIAFEKLPKGENFITYITQLPYSMSSDKKVPFYYTDVEEGEWYRV